MQTILKTNDLTKKYDNKVVVDNLNIEIKEGEIFGLLGPNGAGKSTTMNMICDIVKPTLGNVEFMDKDEDGMGTVEVILIIVVLIGLVIVFKKEISGIVEEVFKAIRRDTRAIIS